ncbi:hypothetical protein [Rhodomicrobium vannielii]|uniref:hypothetical protein n=1 Tax=Rhodomicrobium vannielii TaxID=1069 RepID=UPI0001C2630F|nr:hypothetical protein [Rhodomicrobium vannielii]
MAWLDRQFHKMSCGIDGRQKSGTWADRWLIDPVRRGYDGIGFYPDPADTGAPEGHYNLWKGFDFEARQKVKRYSVFRDHLSRCR